jgi:hypothetical protein
MNNPDTSHGMHPFTPSIKSKHCTLTIYREYEKGMFVGAIIHPVEASLTIIHDENLLKILFQTNDLSKLFENE